MRRISIVIPAHDAAASLAGTLESVCGQSQGDWEAIIVDDGSTDETIEIAAHFTAADPRIRSLRQARAGAGAARNAGVHSARGDWVVFLDSDDRLTPGHLQTMLEAAAARPDSDVLYCGWRRMLDGTPWWKTHPAEAMDDPFLVAARMCPFAIHSGMTKRRALQEIGGFDPSLIIGEDWDLWQRLARSGSRFNPVEGLTAEVSLRAGSLSSDTDRHLRDGLLVIRRGHAPDPRVARPDDRYTDGAPASGLPSAIWYFAFWMAGAALGRGADAVSLLRQIDEPCPPELDIPAVGRVIEDGVVVGAASPDSPWPDLWLRHGERIEALFAWLDARPRALLLGSRLRRTLEEIVEPKIAPECAATIGHYCFQPIDLALPLEDLILPGVDRLRCSVLVAGRCFGTFEEACFGAVSAATLKRRVLEGFVTPELHWALYRIRIRQLDLWLKIFAERGPLRFSLLLLRLARARSKSRVLQVWGARLWRAADFERILLRTTTPGAEAAAAEQVWKRIVAEESARATTARTCSEQATSPGQPAPTSENDFGAAAYWEKVFSRADPWDYRNDYETQKYLQTLDLIRRLPVREALEIACAEGVFTSMLAPLVGRLLATDISTLAVERASATCSKLANVTFGRLDIARDEPPGRYDLIVCSEVLYYQSNRTELARLAEIMARHLEPGGSLVLAHANLLVDEPAATGFGWPHPFGAQGIGEVLSEQPALALAAETMTPLYRIQRFQKMGPSERIEPVRTISDAAPRLPTHVASQVRWRGGQEPEAGETWRDFPILMYHRITADGPAGLARYRVTPTAFAAQLAYLRDNGWSGVTLERLVEAAYHRVNLPERSVMITFDDATIDFLTEALPLLHRYGFPGTVFVPVGKIGAAADWDAGYGSPAPLLDWNELRLLRHCDVSLGAHGFSHAPLSALPLQRAARELARSRLMLENGLDRPVISVAYPFGAVDPAVRSVARACGYRIGLSCFPGRVGWWSDALNLPRIEITGDMDIPRFASAVEPMSP